ncbi:SGNH/GDSL hydrolase family protein [uncultured Sphaerochaeta sp.]|uniref:SGNH/GDSL hydrolase family protein n=1 Tax=uncultured Sphaerochaeta sp. TaxID=886478 RepID=UPI003748B688
MSDSFDISVDGKFLAPLPIKKGMLRACWDNPEKKQVLVKFFFPMCHQVGIKDFSCDQDMLPIKKPSGKILCLGDSIMQGFMAKRPAFGLVPLLCEHLGVEIVNQGICGFGYDPSILDGMEELGLFDCILVELGTNDWNFSPDLPSLERRIASFYSRLTTLFPSIPIFTMTPIWRSDLDELKPCGSFAELSDLIAQEAETYVQVKVIDGLSVSPHKRGYYTDGFLHPNVEGFRYLSEHLVPLLKPVLRI